MMTPKMKEDLCTCLLYTSSDLIQFQSVSYLSKIDVPKKHVLFYHLDANTLSYAHMDVDTAVVSFEVHFHHPLVLQLHNPHKL